MFDLEDVDGCIRCIQWPAEFAEQGQLVQPDSIVLVQGRIDKRMDEANLIVDKVIPIEQVDQNLTTGIKILVDQREHGEHGLKKAYEIVRGYPGNRKLEITLVLENGMLVNLRSSKRIEINDQLCSRLRELLGNSSLEMIVDQKALSARAQPRQKGQYSRT